MINLTSLKDFNRFYPLLVLFFLFTPSFGAIDNVSIRWSFLGFLNVFFLITSIRKEIVSNKLINLLFLLIFFSIISLINSINLAESVLSVFKLLSIVVTVYCLSRSFQNNKNYIEDFVKFIFLILCFEVIYTLYNYYSIDQIKDFTGISMNRNISSFSILIKVPIVFYLKESRKLSSLKFLLFMLELGIVLSLFLLESRAAIGLILLIYFTQIITSFKSKRKLLSYSLIFAISLFFLNINTSTDSKMVNKNSDLLNSLKTDESLQRRLEFIKIGSQLFKEYPIFGSGIGTWKINSRNIKYRSDNSNEVSYYAHNDFIQFLVEIGILGFLTYALIFILIIKEIFKSWRYHKLYKYLIIIFIIIFIDTLINFPFHRPQESILIFSFFTFVISKSTKKVSHRPILIYLMLIILSVFSIWGSLKEHNSLVDQKILLYDYYNSSISLNENQLESINYKIPNLASNTEPLSAILVSYYLNDDKVEKASKLISLAIKSNPFSEYTLKQYIIVLLNTGNFEEALSVSKNLFEKDLNNNEYADTYFSILQLLEMENMFISSYTILNTVNEDIHEIYFTKYLLLQKFSIKSVKILLENSLSLFPNNDLLKSLYSSVLK